MSAERKHFGRHYAMVRLVRRTPPIRFGTLAYGGLWRKGLSISNAFRIRISIASPSPTHSLSISIDCIKSVRKVQYFMNSLLPFYGRLLLYAFNYRDCDRIYRKNEKIIPLCEFVEILHEILLTLRRMACVRDAIQ